MVIRAQHELVRDADAQPALDHGDHGIVVRRLEADVGVHVRGVEHAQRVTVRAVDKAHDRLEQAARAHLRRLRARMGAKAPVKKRNKNQAAAAHLR